MSEHFERALADWREARAEFERYMLDAYEKAAEACRDALVNDLGKQKGIEPLSLFMGNAARARAYASEELIEWWETHPRMPFAAFERQWLAARDAEYEHDVEQRVEARYAGYASIDRGRAAS